MPSTTRNAIIMAAGTSTRFVPLSAEIPKGLLRVNGEVLIERQIRQLQEAGITDITVVVGYKAGMFGYLKDKYGVSLAYNEDYYRYNNTSSLMRVLDRLGDTYICSSDNYFPRNVFMEEPEGSYYSALYAEGSTREYCISTDADGFIRAVTIGGRDSWYMVGHVYFSCDFSRKFREILSRDYELESTRLGYWEDVYIYHIAELPEMRVHRYREHDIEEFDTLDELRQFDTSYLKDTRSSVIKHLAHELQCGEEELHGFSHVPHQGDSLLFRFVKGDDAYEYDGASHQISKI